MTDAPGASPLRVSAVVTNYNHARFLRRRMDSVLAQTHPPFEILYLDDCSTDNSKEIIAPYCSDPRVRCIENDANSGSPYAQINRGVRLACGELIWIAEADDYADPRFLEMLVGVMARHPQVGIAYCQSYEIDEHDTLLRTIDYSSFPEAERWRSGFVANGIEEVWTFLLMRNTIPNFSAVLFRKAIFERAGSADETMRLSGDWFLWIRMLLISDIAYVAEPLNYYRQHAGSVRRRTDLATHMREVYHVAHYCRVNLPLDDATWDTVLTRIMKFWLRNCLKGRSAGDRYHAFRRTCAIAERYDPRFRSRLLWCLADLLSFGGTLQARRWLRLGALTRQQA